MHAAMLGATQDGIVYIPEPAPLRLVILPPPLLYFRPENLPSSFIMPKAIKTLSRRSRTASRVFRDAFVTIRPCSTCISYGFLCRSNRRHLECECCYVNGRKCDLAPGYTGIVKAIKEAEKLDEEILEIRLKLARKER